MAKKELNQDPTLRYVNHCIHDLNHLIAEFENHHNIEKTHYIQDHYFEGVAHLRCARESFKDYLFALRDINSGGI